MGNTSILHARIDSELKENAENIFAKLGLSSSDAIKLFYKQVELHGGLPFDIILPRRLIAEQTLLSELAAGEKSGREQALLSEEESKADLGL